jgi:diguanylate cyclase (GGDEF)-like protein/PAS domain S-box-containing protein
MAAVTRSPVPGLSHDKRLLRRLIRLAILAWTAVVGVSLYVIIHHHREHAYHQAHQKALDHFNKEFAFRLWGTGKGGMYLKVGPDTPPIEYLHFLPNRDARLPDGQQLTLYDPVSALRQITAQQHEIYGIAGRIVGEVPFNPDNLPDAWEARALESFRQGRPEVLEETKLSGKPYLRLMRPMVMTENCLTCHGHQGYKAGDIRAGIGVYVSLEPFLADLADYTQAAAISHCLIWLMGLTGIGFTSRRVDRHLEERVAHLEETGLAAHVFESSLQGVMITDDEGRILRVNNVFTDLTGFSSEDAIGEKPSILRSGHHDPEFYAGMWHDLLAKGRWAGEVTNRRKNGEIFVAWETISTVYDDSGLPRYFIAMFQDVTDQKLANQRIYQLAHYDILTQLPNRQLLGDRITHALDRARRQGSWLGLLFIDLDKFKVVNDTLGHHAGDKLLAIVAERLTKCVRASDTVARLGGDEFAILLEGIDSLSDIERVAEKIITTTAEAIPLEGRQWRIGASVGISLYPRDGEDMGSLLKNADTAMYKAKADGRNRFQFFDASLAQQAAEHVARESALRQAIAEQGLHLHYQPLVDIASGRVIGVEALVRWRHAGKMIPPDEFIPLAEESGLIVPLGQWVAHTACAEIAALTQRLGRSLRLSLNVSALELKHAGYLDTLLQAVSDSGLPPASLELEITETSMMQELRGKATLFERLSDQGISIAIDDFGTGYSSLSYLKRLPVDTLKIDRTFVLDTPTDPDDCAIIRTIIYMGRSLGLRMVAEGVENADQLAFLREQGCDIAQGYLFSRPLPLNELENLLRA